MSMVGGMQTVNGSFFLRNYALCAVTHHTVSLTCVELRIKLERIYGKVNVWFI